ncbi:hypothetical protein QR98_0068800 [Sarcoptes scabiei]|uniref:Uncharacterized protein n=1 Tax=Sarcoptes scabiei TaxID=52283 RepID=A0A132ABK4_SARSC|nr:hypothetical protein QR98_0068800 [Sarcoptes scabiei]
MYHDDESDYKFDEEPLDNYYDENDENEIPIIQDLDEANQTQTLFNAIPFDDQQILNDLNDDKIPSIDDIDEEINRIKTTTTSSLFATDLIGKQKIEEDDDDPQLKILTECFLPKVSIQEEDIQWSYDLLITEMISFHNRLNEQN